MVVLDTLDLSKNNSFASFSLASELALGSTDTTNAATQVFQAFSALWYVRLCKQAVACMRRQHLLRCRSLACAFIQSFTVSTRALNDPVLCVIGLGGRLCEWFDRTFVRACVRACARACVRACASNVLSAPARNDAKCQKQRTPSYPSYRCAGTPRCTPGGRSPVGVDPMTFLWVSTVFSTLACWLTGWRSCRRLS